MEKTLIQLVALLVLLANLFCVESEAHEFCANVFERPVDTFQSLQEKAIFKRVANLALTKLVRDEIVNEMDQAILDKTFSHGFAIYDQIELNGQFIQVGNRLNFHVVHLYLNSSQHKNENMDWAFSGEDLLPENTKTVAFSSRPKGLDMNFVSILAGAIQATRYWLEKHAEVTEVSFVGSEIESDALLPMLIKLGFTQTMEHSRQRLRYTIHR